jgi:hypothetical protein
MWMASAKSIPARGKSWNPRGGFRTSTTFRLAAFGQILISACGLQ